MFRSVTIHNLLSTKNLEKPTFDLGFENMINVPHEPDGHEDFALIRTSTDFQGFYEISEPSEKSSPLKKS